MLTRRQILRLGAAAGASTFVSGRWFTGRAFAVAGPGVAMWQTQKLTKWMDPLPIMPVAMPPSLGGGSEIDDPVLGSSVKADYYSMECVQSTWQFHSQLAPAPTNTYSYAGAQAQYTGVGAAISGYLGPTIVATKGKGVVLDMVNKLPLVPLYADAYDTTIGNGRAAGYPNTSRIAVHLHGGFTPPQWDGHPDSWFDPNGNKGMRYDALAGAPANGTRLWFSNQQGPCLLWYHDHSMYQTRFNPFAGQAAGYVIADDADRVVFTGGLNVPLFPHDVPLVIQDRTFYSDGSMFYPTSSGVPAPPYPHPQWVPEYFGDTPVVNGKAYPFLAVEPRRYRLRFLNGSQARFYELSLGLPMWVIATEQGLLARPVPLKKILLAPAERTEVIVDFANSRGEQLVLTNTAKAPYPTGKAVRIPEIMVFRVKTKKVTDTTADPAKGQLSLPAFQGLLPLPATPPTPTRDWVLKETVDPATGVPIYVRIDGLWFDDSVEDVVTKGSTEIWNWVNLTGDAHPMHPHLIKFQVLGRLPFDVVKFDAAWTAWITAGRDPNTRPAALNYVTGPLQAPAPDEIGWKDTAKAYPGVITQVVAKFDIPPGSQVDMVTGNYRYIQHCHILEHEENEMMRPFEVTP